MATYLLGSEIRTSLQVELSKISFIIWDKFFCCCFKKQKQSIATHTVLLCVHCVCVYRVESPDQWEKLLGFVQLTCSLVGSKPIRAAQETIFCFLKTNTFKDDAADHCK